MSILTTAIEPVKPLADACNCTEARTCDGCLAAQHAARRQAVDLWEPFGPSLDDLTWNAETSPTNRSGYSLADESTPLELLTVSAHQWAAENLDPAPPR